MDKLAIFIGVIAIMCVIPWMYYTISNHSSSFTKFGLNIIFIVFYMTIELAVTVAILYGMYEVYVGDDIGGGSGLIMFFGTLPIAAFGRIYGHYFYPPIAFLLRHPFKIIAGFLSIYIVNDLIKESLASYAIYLESKDLFFTLILTGKIILLLLSIIVIIRVCFWEFCLSILCYLTGKPIKGIIHEHDFPSERIHSIKPCESVLYKYELENGHKKSIYTLEGIISNSLNYTAPQLNDNITAYYTDKFGGISHFDD